MKLFTLFLFIFFTSMTLACPQLTGTYTCKHFIDGYSIDSNVSNEVSEFIINAELFIADNIDHPLAREGVSGFYNSYCPTEQEFVFQQTFSNDDDKVVQTEESVFHFKNQDKNTLYIKQYFTFGESYSLSINDICTRIK